MKNVFDSVIVDKNGCWLFSGRVHPTGYGMYYHRNKTTHAHRTAYTVFYLTIPSSKDDIHHMCRNKLCINPLHLLCVLRSKHPDGGGISNSKKTHCPKEHEYVQSNVYWKRNKSGNLTRVCRMCMSKY